MDPRLPTSTLFRLGLAGLGLIQLTDGLYALVRPRSFYEDFPPGAAGWRRSRPTTRT